MSRWGTWAVLGGALVVIAGAVAWGASAPAAVPAAKLASSLPDALGRDSQRLLPRELAGTWLGMDVRALVSARPKARRNAPADEPLYLVFDEGLGGPKRALYSVGKSSLRLEKVQLTMQLADVSQIAPRLAEHQARFGAPSGIWDCADATANLPTRRFSWTRGQVGVMDIYLVLPDRVAATLYVAPTAVITDSIRRAQCVPTPPERITKFPVPNPNMTAGVPDPHAPGGSP